MNDSYQFLRDKVKLTQQLVNYLVSKSTHSITIIARIININEDLVFDNRDVVLIAEEIVGNNKSVSINPQIRNSNEFGLNGFDGKKLEFFTRTGTDLIVVVKGGDGCIGQKGGNGAEFKEAVYNNPQKGYHTYFATDGQKGLPGGNGGNGGNVIINSIETEVVSINKAILSGGISGPGGEGGEGGYDRICEMVKIIEDTTPPHTEYHEWCEKGKQANKGPKGDDGVNGNEGQLIYKPLNTSDWFEKVNDLCPEWSDYRTNVAEYLFRSVNNPIEISNFGSSKAIILTALSELESAIKLNKNNLAAILLYKRIIVFHSPLGQYRFVDIIPDFESYKSNYTKYFDFVKDIKDIATSYFNLSSLKNSISKVLDSQKLTIASTRKEFENRRDSILHRIENKTKELNKRIERAKELEVLIQKRKTELEDDANSGISGLVKDIQVVVTIGSAIFTGGASLITAATSLAKISDSAMDIFDAVSSLDSFDEFKAAFGEFVDVSRGDLKIEDSSYKKLLKGAKDFTDASNSFNEASNKFSSSAGILLDIEKTINQIKGINIDDGKLKGLLNEQADNLQEIINLKKEIETLNYDKEVAVKQIEVLKATEYKITNLLLTEEENKVGLFLDFLEMMKLSQVYMDYLMMQIFNSYRSLEILQFKDYSDKISYHFGYYHPDLESDCIEFKNDVSQIRLFEAYNKSWADIGKSVIHAQSEFDSFSKNSNWNNYTLRLSLKSSLLQAFLANPMTERISFIIDGSISELSNKRFVIIQSVKLGFVNAKVKSGNSEFNAIIYQSGNVSQRIEDYSFKSILLDGLKHGISDVETEELGDNVFAGATGVIGFNTAFKLSYRPVFSNYEISIEPSELSKLDLKDVSDVQVWFKCVYRD